MRTALGAPLQNISETVLNRVISKSIQADLRKYKMGSKKADRGPSNERTRTRSPKRGTSAHHEEDVYEAPSHGDLSKEVGHYLNQLSTSS